MTVLAVNDSTSVHTHINASSNYVLTTYELDNLELVKAWPGFSQPVLVSVIS